MSVDEAELKRRYRRILEYMDTEGLDAVVATSEEDIYYITGVSFKTIERPFLAIVTRTGVDLVLPKLEEEHYESRKKADWEVHVYEEYPSGPEGSWVRAASGALEGCRRIGVTPDTRIEIVQGLAEIANNELQVSKAFARSRMVKTEAEIEAIRYSARIASWIISDILDNYGEGAVELVIYRDARNKAFKRILSEVEDPDLSVTEVLAAVWMDERSSQPHSIPSPFETYRGPGPHTVIVTVRVNGYYAEVERTFFTRRPGREEKTMFETMLEARHSILDAVREGADPGELDRLARRILSRIPHARILHRSGHGIGLTLHEEPYLAAGYEVKLEGGMVFSVEPGLYIRGRAGFRHSDTVLLAGGKPVLLTNVPENLDDLIVGKASLGVRLKSALVRRLFKK